ncbi:MAG: hypothetical protein ABIH66_07235 [bacterium]
MCHEEDGKQPDGVGGTDVKVYDDGKIEIFNLDFDYYRDCK